MKREEMEDMAKMVVIRELYVVGVGRIVLLLISIPSQVFYTGLPKAHPCYVHNGNGLSLFRCRTKSGTYRSDPIVLENFMQNTEVAMD